jgi:FAD/FMN-containing dehydrogenase
VAPTTADDVSKAVKILTHLHTPFTVKAGGHTPFAGASNIPNGVTLDLASLDTITLSHDHSTVSVGPGARWINVSETLDPHNLAAVGGRSSTVGVAGLTLGGGISYFSGTHGWACDNVRAYEVVLPSSKIITATPHAHPDLYWALRGGGGSNFGIVTRFDLATLPQQGPLWASTRVYPGSANATLIPLMHALLVDGLASDPHAHTYFVMNYAPQLGGHVVLSDQFHSTHTSTTAPPAVFAAFHDDAALPTLVNNTRLSNVSRLSRDIEQAGGTRQTWWVTTVKATATADLLLEIVGLYEKNVERLLGAAAAANATLSPFLIYQAISTNILEAMQVNGGNALGLTAEDGPLMIVQLNASWENEALDEVIERSLEELVARIDALAESRGARSKNGYIYMNYAGRTQDVYAGYGEENRARLRSVANKYDPGNKFRNLWKGYFKV